MSLPVACVDIAAGLAGKSSSFDRSAALASVGAGEKAYPSALNAVRRMLKLPLVVDMRDLALKHGAVRAAPIATRLMTTFKQKWIEQRCNGTVDFEKNPVWTGVAFVLAARALKLKTDRKAVMRDLSVGEAEWNKVANLYNQITPEVVVSGGPRPAAVQVAGKRKRVEAPEGNVKTEPGEGATEKRARQEDYDAWKAKILAGREKDAAAAKAGAAKPQSSLESFFARKSRLKDE